MTAPTLQGAAASASDAVAILRAALRPFAEASRDLHANAPNGYDDGLTVLAHVHARPEREADLSTQDFATAKAAYDATALLLAPPAGGRSDLDLLRQAASAGRLRIKCRERLDGADPDAGLIWPIEVELPCINGLSAWFTLGNIYSPDRAAQGYTDGALNDGLARAFADHIVNSFLTALAPPAVPESVRRAFEGVNTGPLAYRPDDFDDWGTIRQVRLNEDGFQPFIARIRVSDSEEEQAAARRERRDPRSTGVLGPAFVAAFNWILEAIAATPSPESAAGGEREIEAAMRPFAVCVFNDNGDVTISEGNLTVHDWLRLDRVHRSILSAPAGAQTAGGETLQTIAQWCEDTFGPITPERIATRANEEMVELLAEPSKVEEAADVVIVLSRYPGLWDAIERKMKVNRARRWRFMGDGTGYHVKDAPPSSTAHDAPEGGR